MGIYQLAMPYYSIITSISLSGITMAVTRLTVEKVTVGDRNATASVVRRSIQLFLALLSCTAVVTFIFPDFIAGTILGDIKTKAAMLMIIPCLFFTGFENIYKSFFYGVKNVKPNIISEISELSIRIIIIFILLFLNKNSLTPEKTAFLIILTMVISEVFSFGFLGLRYKIYQREHKAKYIHTKSKNKGITSEIAGIAVPISAASLLMTVISSINTILIPKRLIASGMTRIQAVETLGILTGMTLPADVK
jgi:stage V sporulation protein B